jgi:uncharacterized protein
MSDVFQAATDGDAPALRAALDAAPDQARAFNTDGWTALHLAAHYGQLAAVRLLLDRGAQVGAVSRNAMANHPLHAGLAGQRDSETARALIEAGADVNGRGASGITPLHLAASRGDVGLIAMLLQAGADPTARMDDGQSAADLARARGFAEAAERLGQ